MTHQSIVTISARTDTADPPFHSQFLPAGRWIVCAISGDNAERCAWNAWGGAVEGCDTPSTCTKGWLNTYRLFAADFPPHAQTVKIGNGRYETPELALAAAQPHAFTLVHPSVISLFIHDTFSDNQGGLTLSLDRLGD